MGKKQTDEFLDWLALGGEEGQETFKHQMGRHNQQRHGWRYGDTLDGDARQALVQDSGNRIWRKRDDYAEYGRRVSNPAAMRARAAARARSQQRRERIAAAQRIANQPTKPAGVEAQKKPKTLPPAGGMRDVHGMQRNLERDRGFNQEFIDDLNMRGIRGTRALVNRMFDTFEVYDKASGLSSKITSVIRDGYSLNIFGEIYTKEGAVAGNFKRIIFRNASGQLEVHHNYFKLESRFEGTGFGSRFVRHLEQKYKKLGVDKISLFANLDVGGYAWARMGFDFEGGYGLSAFKDRAMKKWQQLYHAPMPARMASSIKHAWDIAALRGPDGANIGKMVMLGESWDAEKYLTGDRGRTLGFRVGEAYYDGKQ